MAKLTPDLQEGVKNAQSSGFDPLPDGAYHLRLRDVDTTKSGEKGPYWSWEFEIIDDFEWTPEDAKTPQNAKGRRLWNNTSLSEKAFFKMKETFDAFGVDVDTDTDELIGKVVKGQVSQRTIQQGARKGELANQIDRLKPADQEVVAAVAKKAQGAKEAAEIF